MRSLLLTCRRVLAAANGVDLFDGPFDARARKLFRSPIGSCCVGALLGMLLGSVGALVAPEMLLGLTLMFAVYCGLLGAALAGLTRWEDFSKSAECVCLPYGPGMKRRLLRARLTLAAVPTGVCLAAALLSQKPFVVFMFYAAFLMLVIAIVGMVALTVEIFRAAGKLAARAIPPTTPRRPTRPGAR